MIDKRQRLRLIWVAVLLNCALFGVASRLVCLHLKPDAAERDRAAQIRRLKESLIAPRGQIYEASASPGIVAMNLAVKDICVDPFFVMKQGKAQVIAARLARSLQLDPAFVMSRLDHPASRFAYIDHFVPEQRAEQVNRLKLSGVFTQDTLARHYPHGSFMCHVVGFANVEGVGSAGIEQQMEKYLKGCPGLIESKLDGSRERNELYAQRQREIPAQAGADVYLTVDQNIQFMVEKALDEAVRQNRAKAAWIIVERIRTGEILAMASRPAFDLNNFRAASDNEKLNRTIGTVYEPGSTMKGVTISAALNEGVVAPDTVFDCENGSWLYQKKILRDFHAYGNLTVADIVKKSSNIGAAKVALMLGDQNLDAYMRRFGIGNRLGIDLPGEQQGILHPAAQWSRISATRIGIGQGVAVTALQMLGVYCAIANDGFLMRPYLVQKVVKNDGTLLFRAEPDVLSRPISGQTAATMRTLLARVTEDGGTGRKARVDGYTVAGKTGTAQKPIGGVYSENDYTSSFVGFLPAEQPEIGIIVVVDEPQPEHTGGLVAAPVFGEIGTQIVRYLDIPTAGYQTATVTTDSTAVTD